MKWLSIIVGINIAKVGVMLILAAGVLFILNGCDGGARVMGHVYTCPAPTGVSEAFIDQQTSTNTNLIPLEGALVMLCFDDAHANEMRSKGVYNAITSSNGEFNAFTLCSPFPSELLLIVEKPGYMPSSKAIRHHGTEEHTAVVVLAPEARPKE